MTDAGIRTGMPQDFKAERSPIRVNLISLMRD